MTSTASPIDSSARAVAGPMAAIRATTPPAFRPADSIRPRNASTAFALVKIIQSYDDNRSSAASIPSNEAGGASSIAGTSTGSSPSARNCVASSDDWRGERVTRTRGCDCEATTKIVADELYKTLMTSQVREFSWAEAPTTASKLEDEETMAEMTPSAAAAGTFTIGGDLKVNRLGYGAMRITGDGVWGPPKDKPGALATLRRAVELNVNLIDTADSYGPNVSEELIAEALFPSPAGLVIATKGGWERVGPGQWIHNASPKHLAEALEGSLKRLKLDRIDIYQLHISDPAVSFEASVETLARLRDEGKIRHVALSNVTKEHIQRAEKIVPIVSAQNRYSFADRESDFIVDYCEQQSIAFFPWAPLGQAREAHDAIKQEDDLLSQSPAGFPVTPLQVPLAWLLKRSPVIVPIPGTSNPQHLEQNITAAGLCLPD